MKNALVLFSFLLLVLVDCKVSNKRAGLYSIISAYQYSDSLYTEGLVEGTKYDGFKMIPKVSLNGEALPMGDFDYDPTHFYYSIPSMSINLGNQYKLKVEYGDGTSEATDTMPSEFNFTSPDSNYVLHQGNALNIAWGRSTGANWYLLHIDLYYYYGYLNSFSLVLDTVVNDTSFALIASRIFPSYVDSIEYGYGSIDIEAYSGPEKKPGIQGNFKGDAVGFFWCCYQARSTYFDIEEYTGKSKVNHQLEIRKIHHAALRKFALDYQ